MYEGVLHGNVKPAYPIIILMLDIVSPEAWYITSCILQYSHASRFILTTTYLPTYKLTCSFDIYTLILLCLYVLYLCCPLCVCQRCPVFIYTVCAQPLWQRQLPKAMTSAGRLKNDQWHKKHWQVQWWPTPCCWVSDSDRMWQLSCLTTWQQPSAGTRGSC